MKTASVIHNHKSEILPKLRVLWPYYILQSFLAALALFIIVLVLKEKKIVVISAMGATSFIVFAMPQSISAKTKNIIGGHLIGLAAGALFYLFRLPPYLSYPLTVGLAVFIMVALDLEHPPAAGTALAVVMNEVSADVFVTIMLSAVILSQIRYYLRHRLKDLV